LTATDTDTVLRDPQEAAVRQRERLAASAGRSRPAALLRRLPLVARAATTEEAARAGLRYQPVAWTVIAVVAIAWWVPGRDDGERASGALAAAPFVTTTTAPAAPAPDAPAGPPSVPSVSLSPPATTPVTSGSRAPAASAPPSSSPSPAAAAPATPLAVRGFGWASRLSGTGVSAAEVPEETIPVANRLGQLDKASFVRLAGTATTLELTEVDEGAREAIGAGLVVACPITDAAWSEDPDQSLDAAPSWDATACVTGVEDDGVWTFDLSGFDADGDAGFALVPDASAPADFQIAFAAGG
jgi:hypothetical protein